MPIYGKPLLFQKRKYVFIILHYHFSRKHHANEVTKNLCSQLELVFSVFVSFYADTDPALLLIRIQEKDTDPEHWLL